jgi:zinc protease
MEDKTMKRNLPAMKFSSPLRIAVVCLILTAGNVSICKGEAGPDWPQKNSDVKADPAVLFGKLPNGMRYAIMKNATPAGQASLRLRIGSGSLQESDEQQGLAHFLEHMAFKGSKRVPEGEMVKILQRKGLAFGPDTNAYTSFTETVYMLDLPETDPETVGTGLMLMRETASELTLDAKAMEPERGVVLSEERLRDTPQRKASDAHADFLLDGMLAARRSPIGKVGVIKNAPVSLLQDYYKANYRPDRSALIVVGDIDPAVIEGSIKGLFSDWQAAGPAVPEPDLGVVKPRGLAAKVITVPGLSTLGRISWIRPRDTRADSEAKRRSDLIESLGLTVLNRRLAKLAQSEHPPFLSARAGFSNFRHSAEVASIYVTSAPASWRQALAAAEQELRRIVQFGVRQEELEREITEFRVSSEQAAAAAATRRTKLLAASIVNSIDSDDVFTAPADRLSRFEAYVKGLTVAHVNAALADIFKGSGPLVDLDTPEPLQGGDAELAAEYTNANAAPVSAPAAEAAAVWPYRIFGAPGEAAEQKDIADFGVIAVRFANGVRLNIKPTKFRDQEVLVDVRVGNGRLDMPANHSGWLTSAFTAGGLKALTEQDMQRALASNIFASRFETGDDAFELGGHTRPQDLDVQLQVLAAYVTEPGYRPESVERMRTSLITNLEQYDKTPEGVYRYHAAGLLHAGDKRWESATREDAEAAKPDDLKAMLQGPLSSGAIEVTVVGDITAEAVIKAVAATFGALPPRAAPQPPGSTRNMTFPAPVPAPVEMRHKGRADQAIAFLAWPANGFFADMQQSRALTLAAEIFRDRLREQIRVVEGATYSPGAGHEASWVFPGYGFAWTKVETPPAKIGSFYANVSKIAGEMRSVKVSEDELARARNPVVEGLKKRQLTNEYWLGRLSGSQADPRMLEAIRTAVTGYMSVTPEDIRTAAAAYFADERAWKLVILPEGGTASQ